MSQSFASKRDYWRAQIDEWKRSGKSGRDWAASHGRNYQTFLYWKSRFQPTLKKEDFVELSEKRSESLLIQYQGIQIEIREHFNTETLSRLLTVIKSALC